VRRWYEHLGGKVIGERSFRVEDWDLVEIAYGWQKLSALLPADRSAQAV
jgi:hypothetical protein